MCRLLCRECVVIVQGMCSEYIGTRNLIDGTNHSQEISILTSSTWLFTILVIYSHTSSEVETLHFYMIVMLKPRQIGAERFTEQ